MTLGKQVGGTMTGSEAVVPYSTVQEDRFPPTYVPFLKESHLFVCLGATLAGAQVLLLSLNSVITPAGLRRSEVVLYELSPGRQCARQGSGLTQSYI